MMSPRATMLPSFTLVLSNRNYSPPPYHSLYHEKYYPPPPEPFSRDDPLMRTVDYRFVASGFDADLCLPAMSDIEEEDEETDGVVIIAEEAAESSNGTKRPKISVFLKDLLFVVKLKFRKLRSGVLAAPKQNLEVDLLS